MLGPHCLCVIVNSGHVQTAQYLDAIPNCIRVPRHFKWYIKVHLRWQTGEIKQT